ncbi:PilZ domain-containing protein [Altererythrobacter sp. MF3-039]|uniref:PilZ domain-containing protein n=1 Tax=Altererythrobacter sp. MF3-039 TaxID=3252901 RepID=UPI00390C7623
MALLFAMQTRELARTSIDTRAQCRTSDGSLRVVSLVDVANGGCKICDDGLPFRIGQQLKLLVASSPPLRAIVRWTGDGEAGVAFMRPLTDAQVNHLRDPDAACASLDRTWNPLEGVTPGAPLRRAC